MGIDIKPDIAMRIHVSPETLQQPLGHPMANAPSRPVGCPDATLILMGPRLHLHRLQGRRRSGQCSSGCTVHGTLAVPHQHRLAVTPTRHPSTDPLLPSSFLAENRWGRFCGGHTQNSRSSSNTMVKIVVIGASGYIGKPTLSHLLKLVDPATVYIATRNPDAEVNAPYKAAGAHVIHGDLGNYAATVSAFAGADTVYIIAPGTEVSVAAELCGMWCRGEWAWCDRARRLSWTGRVVATCVCEAYVVWLVHVLRVVGVRACCVVTEPRIAGCLGCERGEGGGSEAPGGAVGVDGGHRERVVWASVPRDRDGGEGVGSGVDACPAADLH